LIAFVYHLELRNYPFLFPPDEQYLLQTSLRAALVLGVILTAIAFSYEASRTANLREATESVARYQAIARRGSDLLLELNEQRLICFISEEHANNLGWARTELLGRALAELLPVADRLALERACERAFLTGDATLQPLHLACGSGARRWFQPSFSAYVAPARGQRLVVVLQDLTELLAIEQRLRQSEKMDAVGQLASGLAHDFNNLLMVIMSYGEYLQRKLPEGDERRAAAQIVHAAERGAGLTRQLRATAISAEQELAPLAVAPMLRSMRETVQQVLGESVALTLSVSTHAGSILADRSQLQQILINLATNARDAMPQGGEVLLQAQRQADEVRIVFRDNGAGMSADVLDRAFEAFYTTKKRHEGTGLGLYVVYSAVHAMSGQISVRSTPGSGTTIEITFPLIGTEAREEPVPASPAQLKLARGCERLMLVEDRGQVLRAVDQLLVEANYQTVLAGSGEQALQLLSDPDHKQIDLLITDVVLPGIDGLELARRARHQQAGLPCLFLSGQSTEIDRQEFADPLFLAKPVHAQELLARVRQTLDERKASDMTYRNALPV